MAFPFRPPSSSDGKLEYDDVATDENATYQRTLGERVWVGDRKDGTVSI